jgi:RNA polymerase sigma-70 factor (ECF subfamily)
MDVNEAAALARALDEENRSATATVDRARALVVANFQRIWRILRRLGVPESDAEDAAQQVFVIATARLSDIPAERERSFLYATALRIASIARRNQARRQKWVELGYEDSTSSGLLADEEMERRDALAFIDEVLQRMHDDLRQVFVLREIEELTAPEVSELVGIPVGTVASRLRRARRAFDERAVQLRAELARER